MKICVYTLGCKVNQYESGAIAHALKQRGHEVTTALERADLYIINTCAVTNEAERKSRQIVARCGKLAPGAKVVVCGCSSQRQAQRFEGERRLIFGTSHKGSIADSLEKSGVLAGEPSAAYEDDLLSETERVRAYVKVQDGCDNFCSYCIVPYLRGRSRSRAPESVLAEIASHTGSIEEFVITGIDLSDYGKGIGESLAGLMRRLTGVKARIRLGSLEVRVIDEAFLLAIRDIPAFCPHFHLSLQSGSDGVLRRMNRHYTTAQYLDKVELIRSYFPEAGVTTDVIAGFPTETEEEHAETKDFVRRVGFSDIHVFGYSKRDGTAAAKLRQLPPEVVKRRTDDLLAIRDEVKTAFLRRAAGKRFRLLLEEEENGYATGYTENYIRCFLPCRAGETVNGIVEVAGEAPYRDGLLVRRV